MIGTVVSGKAFELVERESAQLSLELARELFGIRDLLRSSAGLRRALTEGTVGSEEKRALLRSIFAGRVSDDALSVAGAIVGKRWRGARPLLEAFADAAAATTILAVEKASQAAGLEQLERELFTFTGALREHDQLSRALSAVGVPATAKGALLTRLLRRASEPMQLLAESVIREDSASGVARVVRRYEELVAARRGRCVATVEVASPLDSQQLNRLLQALSALYGRALSANVRVIPGMLGGVRAQVGDEVVDATIIARLGHLRQQLVG